MISLNRDSQRILSAMPVTTWKIMVWRADQGDYHYATTLQKRYAPSVGEEVELAIDEQINWTVAEISKDHSTQARVDVFTVRVDQTEQTVKDETRRAVPPPVGRPLVSPAVARCRWPADPQNALRRVCRLREGEPARDPRSVRSRAAGDGGPCVFPPRSQSRRRRHRCGHGHWW
jgi:hypothetical protein